MVKGRFLLETPFFAHAHTSMASIMKTFSVCPTNLRLCVRSKKCTRSRDRQGHQNPKEQRTIITTVIH